MKMLYVKYDWEHMMHYGEETTEKFCFAEKQDAKVITSLSGLQEYCGKFEKSDCKGVCKMSKVKKKDKKKGVEPVCGPGKAVKKNTVKCSKLKDEETCAMLGCTA